MGRPERNDVDYFPHEVHHGRKMHIIENAFGNNGYAVWFKLLEELGKATNHYIDLRDDTSLLYLESKLGDNQVMEIIERLAKLGVIHTGLWSHKIIWNEKFVKGVEDAYKRRNNKCWQLTDICMHLGIKCEHEPCYCGQCVGYNPQSKVKDSKEEKIKSTPLQNFIISNFPNVSKLEYQLTFFQSNELEKKYRKDLIAAKVHAMENQKNLTKKYTSVYITLDDWCRNAVDSGKWKRKEPESKPAGPKEMSDSDWKKHYAKFIKKAEAVAQ